MTRTATKVRAPDSRPNLRFRFPDDIEKLVRAESERTDIAIQKILERRVRASYRTQPKIEGLLGE